MSVCIKVQKWRQTETKVTFRPPENFFLSQMKGMAKIRLFYSGAMALILPQLKDIANFVYKLINVPDMGDRQQFSEGGLLFLFPPKELYSLEDRQHLGGLPFCPNVQHSLSAKPICLCPFCFVYHEKLLKLSNM